MGMKPEEIEFISNGCKSLIKDVYYNSFERDSYLGRDIRVVIFHKDLLSRIGLTCYLDVMDKIHDLEYDSKSLHCFLTDGVNYYSDPLSLGQVIDIQINHNGYIGDYRL